MSEHEKKACPECGKMVSSHRLPWSHHMKTHAKPTEKPVEAVKQEAPKAVAAVEDDGFKKIKDPELLQALIDAAEAQKRFREAPQTFVADMSSDEMLELRRRYLPESIEKVEVSNGKVRVVKPATLHEYFDSPSNLRKLAAAGYAPVVDKSNGKMVVSNTGLALYSCPQELYLARMKSAAKESDNRLRQPTEGIRDAKGNRVVADGVREEVSKVETTTLKATKENESG